LRPGGVVPGAAAAVARGVGAWWCEAGRGVGARRRWQRRAAAAGEGMKTKVKNKPVRGYVNRLCRVLVIWHSGKYFFNFKIYFAECQIAGTRQSYLCRAPTDKHSTKVALIIFKNVVPSVLRMTLGRASFAECLTWALGKVYFYFFYFANQTFCGMLLHYVDLHVPFWDNYKSVFYNYWI
jgi:hypothetical protein